MKKIVLLAMVSVLLSFGMAFGQQVNCCTCPEVKVTCICEGFEIGFAVVTFRPEYNMPDQCGYVTLFSEVIYVTERKPNGRGELRPDKGWPIHTMKDFTRVESCQ